MEGRKRWTGHKKMQRTNLDVSALLPGGPAGPLCPLTPVPACPRSPFSPGKPSLNRKQTSLKLTFTSLWVKTFFFFYICIFALPSHDQVPPTTEKQKAFRKEEESPLSPWFPGKPEFPGKPVRPGCPGSPRVPWSPAGPGGPGGPGELLRYPEGTWLSIISTLVIWPEANE